MGEPGPSGKKSSALNFQNAGTTRQSIALATSTSDLTFTSTTTSGRDAGYLFYNGATLLLDIGHDGKLAVNAGLGIHGVTPPAQAAAMTAADATLATAIIRIAELEAMLAASTGVGVHAG